MNKTGTEIRQKQSTRTTAINSVNVHTAKMTTTLLPTRSKSTPLSGSFIQQRQKFPI
jgi:hypothetical protein